VLHAVIIGIDKYKDPRIQRLYHARDDAEAFADRLASNIHPDDRSVKLLVDSGATVKAIRTEIGEHLPRRAEQPNDLIIVYFAGHGSPETKDDLPDCSRFLIAHDTDYDHIFATAIDLEQEIVRWFTRIHRPHVVLFFLDACFSGRAGGRTFEGPRLRAARPKTRAVQTRLKNLSLGAGRLILAACDDDQVAGESSSLRHGIFTFELLSILSEKSKERTIAVTRLYDCVRSRVLDRTQGMQEPVLNGRLVGAQMLRLPKSSQIG
jgi:uncharacterized caspase-like protein